jgi:two-component system capsular synthesis sensor histidine kinase RcsC
MAPGDAPTTPLYALTASCSDEERARCAEAGMVDLIAKPIRIDGLEALLRKHAHPPRTLSGSEPRGPFMRPGAELGI